jgi:heme a synthase
MLSRSDKQIVTWLLSGCFLVFTMVVVGGITRLTHSGLSITEWNLVMGTFPPLSEQDWITVFEKYKLSPEFQKVNYTMSLDDFRFIFWWEYSHRLIGRLIGIVFLVPFLYFLLKGKLSRPLIYRLGGVFLLGAFQGFLGWYMVASGLVDNPRVSHYRLAAHLITAFITFGYILWLVLDIVYPRPAGSRPARPLRAMASWVLAITVVQIIYGAFVAGLRAGLVYNTFPKMGSQWMPDAVTAMSPFWKNLTENLAGVQFVHRTTAWVLLGLILSLPFVARRHELTDNQKRGLNLLTNVVAIQFLLGMFTILYAVPLSLGLLHQLGAFFLFASAIFFYHQTRNQAAA